MEQTIWVVFGVLAAIVAFGALASVVSQHSQADTARLKQEAIDQLVDLCDQVCAEPLGTRLRRTVPIPAESVIITDVNRVCAAGEQPYCGLCGCATAPAMVINLTGARGYFTVQPYDCSAEHTPDAIVFSCEG